MTSERFVRVLSAPLVELPRPASSALRSLALNKDLDKESLLREPDLRTADKKILEGAWLTYRRILLEIWGPLFIQ